MKKEIVKNLIEEQRNIAMLLLEEKSKEKTAIEVIEDNQLLIAAFVAVDKAITAYLI